MKITFVKDYGSFAGGLTYDVPDVLAEDLIREGRAKKYRKALDLNPQLPECRKVMKPSQVTQRGGL
jgi:hypothetical protein